MLAYAPHDVRITQGIRSLPPQDGWTRYEATGQASLTCSCGHMDGPMDKRLVRLMSRLHIHGYA
jgi:hypothetical protein